MPSLSPATPVGPHADTVGLVLAGGRGSRMGGADKGLQPWLGRPLATHVAERLKPQVGELWINVNRNEAAYRELGFAVLTDADPAAFDGPLAGMLAGLRRLGTRPPGGATSPLAAWLLTAPCDSPRLPLDLADRLHRGVAVAGSRLGMARVGGQYEPVFCLLHASLAPSLAQYLARGERKIDRWVFSEGGVAVDFADEAACFANANTLQDLGALGTRS